MYMEFEVVLFAVMIAVAMAFDFPVEWEAWKKVGGLLCYGGVDTRTVFVLD